MSGLKGEKILLTGPAGQIAFPIGRELARDNEVWGIARVGDPADRERVEQSLRGMFVAAVAGIDHGAVDLFGQQVHRA